MESTWLRHWALSINEGLKCSWVVNALLNDEARLTDFEWVEKSIGLMLDHGLISKY